MSEVRAAVALCRTLGRAKSWKQLISGFVRHASMFPGVSSIQFRPAADLCYLPEAGTHAEASEATFAVDAEAKANGRTWGVCSFRLKAASYELTAPFLAEQLAVACSRHHLLNRNEDLRLQLWYLAEEIAVRKALNRACGIITADTGLQHEQGELILRAYARRNGTSLRALAENVIRYPDRLAELSGEGFDMDPMRVPQLYSKDCERFARVS
jgi:hypothetical protein